MKLEFKIDSKYVEQKDKESEDFKLNTFLILAESKKGNVLPLIVEFRSKDDIDILVFNRKGYNTRANVTLNALVNNPIIKGVAGTSQVALGVKSLIEDNMLVKMTKQEREAAISKISNFNVSEMNNTIDSILTEKMKQKTSDKYELLNMKTKEDLNNKFIIIYEHLGKRVYLNAVKKGEDIFLENPLVKEIGAMKMSVNDLAENPDVIGIYGTNELALKIKELHTGNKIRLKTIQTRLVEFEKDIVDVIQGKINQGKINQAQHSSTSKKKFN